MGDSSFSSFQNSPQERSVKRVQFVETEDGKVQCNIVQVETLDNKATELWWTSEEIAQHRAECHDIVERHEERAEGIAYATMKFLSGNLDEDVRYSRRLLMQMSLCPDVRGLEHHFVELCGEMAQTHRDTVLKSKGASARQLRKVSKALSKPARELALRRGQQDRKEALKASLTSWL